MNCYKCFDTENLSIKTQNKNTGYKLYICKVCRNKAAKARISKQATRPHRIRTDHTKLRDLWDQHHESMNRILTKLKAGGYSGR